MGEDDVVTVDKHLRCVHILIIQRDIMLSQLPFFPDGIYMTISCRDTSEKEATAECQPSIASVLRVRQPTEQKHGEADKA